MWCCRWVSRSIVGLSCNSLIVMVIILMIQSCADLPSSSSLTPPRHYYSTPSHFPIPAATIHVSHISRNQQFPNSDIPQHQPSRIHARRPLQEPPPPRIFPVGFKTFFSSLLPTYLSRLHFLLHGMVEWVDTYIHTVYKRPHFQHLNTPARFGR